MGLFKISKYNIDLYRMEASENGTIDYYPARRSDIRGALETPHVTHLSRYGRTVAMRRYDECTKSGRVEYLATTDGGEETLFTSLEKATDFIIDYLNQGEHGWEAGDHCKVWANQAHRDATCLAVIGTEILVEYQMPGTTGQWGYNRRTGR